MSTGLQKSWIAGVFAAFSASLCCIVPVVALIGGAGGVSTYFNWVEPYRPYIIGLTVAIFALAWYNILTTKSLQKNDCGCETERKGFLSSKKFLFVVTVISSFLIAFPYYSSLLYASQKTGTVGQLVPKKLETAELAIQGMSCAGCTSHIDGGLRGIGGISKSTTSFEKAKTVVSYDPSRISADSISKKIKQIGYSNTRLTMSVEIELNSAITCPKCGFTKMEEMPTDSCQYFYDCENCGKTLKPLTGDCCVFCSYGSVKCPPIQQGTSCCG